MELLPKMLYFHALKIKDIYIMQFFMICTCKNLLNTII